MSCLTWFTSERVPTNTSTSPRKREMSQQPTTQSACAEADLQLALSDINSRRVQSSYAKSDIIITLARFLDKRTSHMFSVANTRISDGVKEVSDRQLARALKHVEDFQAKNKTGLIFTGSFWQYNSSAPTLQPAHQIIQDAGFKSTLEIVKERGGFPLSKDPKGQESRSWLDFIWLGYN